MKRVVIMQIKYIVGLAFVAMLALPATASQIAARAAATPTIAPFASTLGLFSDPDAQPALSITLPTRFVAPVDITQPLQHFAG